MSLAMALALAALAAGLRAAVPEVRGPTGGGRLSLPCFAPASEGQDDRDDAGCPEALLSSAPDSDDDDQDDGPEPAVGEPVAVEPGRAIRLGEPAHASHPAAIRTPLLTGGSLRWRC